MFWCITTHFNPARSKSRLENYGIFEEALRRQRANLLTVELAFEDHPFQLPAAETTLRLRGRSMLWQKERMLNWAMTRLPAECRYFAWLDADILLGNDDWIEMAVSQLQKVHAVHLFEKIVYLPPGHKTTRLRFEPVWQNNLGYGVYKHGIAWQAKAYPDWLELRRRGQLHYSVPGGAWAARRDVIANIGLYDRHVLGGNDTIFADALLGAWGIHGYLTNSGDRLRRDALIWGQTLARTNPTYSYLPQDAFHLFHGSLDDRQYVRRDQLLLDHDFDPQADIRRDGDVFEWTSNKPRLHAAVADYFSSRKEDD
jgi:hypothetical protein